MLVKKHILKIWKLFKRGIIILPLGLVKKYAHHKQGLRHTPKALSRTASQCCTQILDYIKQPFQQNCLCTNVQN